ncbi:hydroxyisourate hydrolase [Simiduia sp. 21SJ11W-1]|uniref:hydroxyisourate hydrolase n=1 Tax=Simiduia sp. 21SJ11W-1 TaxID=2909669 RepID=UPI0020A07B94|nr:hydroxyisourate hydrolase [Simiduia sp. 21SJ11W-1]UTA48284.1 hydroxyisourate hydrolase [Simiduia sp. 21SJ11W-1]
MNAPENATENATEHTAENITEKAEVQNTPKAPITTHVLDLDAGRPAEGLAVSLWAGDALLASATTDADGRVIHWPAEITLTAGDYCLVFDVAHWFERQSRTSFYPEVSISFTVASLNQHYHVPLLLNAHGYSTYRGS